MQRSPANALANIQLPQAIFKHDLRFIPAGNSCDRPQYYGMLNPVGTSVRTHDVFSPATNPHFFFFPSFEYTTTLITTSHSSFLSSCGSPCLSWIERSSHGHGNTTEKSGAHPEVRRLASHAKTSASRKRPDL